MLCQDFAKMDVIGIAVPATSMVVGLSSHLDEAGVPRRMAWDLLALRERPFSRNQRQRWVRWYDPARGNHSRESYEI